MEETLLAGLPALGLTLTPAQVDTLCRFGRALLEMYDAEALWVYGDGSVTWTEGCVAYFHS